MLVNSASRIPFFLISLLFDQVSLARQLLWMAEEHGFMAFYYLLLFFSRSCLLFPVFYSFPSHP
jgi:hypothetical protein